MESLQLWISLILGGMAVMTNIFLVYNYFAKKDISFDKTLGINGATCSLKHKIIDDKFESIAQELTLIKENHLKHIESDISLIKTDIAIILDRESRPTKI